MPRPTKRTLPCAQCDGLCCRYMAIQIDSPETATDYDDIRWHLLHRNVRLLIDREGDWLVAFDTPCSRLGPDGRCQDYENRPLLCRSYPDGRACEFDGPIFVEEFASIEDFDAWLVRQ